jgi:hypothetical protein
MDLYTFTGSIVGDLVVIVVLAVILINKLSEIRRTFEESQIKANSDMNYLKEQAGLENKTIIQGAVPIVQGGSYVIVIYESTKDSLNEESRRTILDYFHKRGAEILLILSEK